MSLLLFLALAGTACAPEPPPQPPAPAEPQPDPARLQALLSAADAAARDGQLDYPFPGSALDLWQQATLLDPDNLTARRGLESIVETYLTEVRQALDDGRFATARSFLARARLVDAAHPGIEPMATQLALLESARRTVRVLDDRQLSSRSAAMVTLLRTLGATARGDNCRTRIQAGSDADGRWIYARLSDAPGDQRIRAQMEIGKPARVEVSCFQ